MTSCRFQVGLLAVLVIPVVNAQVHFEAWQAFDVPLVDSKRFNAVLHSQIRERQRLRDFFHARAGPVIRYRLKPRLALIGGYYFGEFEVLRDHWGNDHRTFGGFESVRSVGRNNLSLRTMVEHHFGGPDAPELRARQQVTVTRALGKYAAYGGCEPFFDVKGLLMQRWIAGWRIPLNTRDRMDVSYYFDHRVARAGDSRHVIQTAFRPRRVER